MPSNPVMERSLGMLMPWSWAYCMALSAMVSAVHRIAVMSG
jgi:hypothetical protein